MSLEETILAVRTEVQEHMEGVTGAKRADELEMFIREMLVEYAAVLGFSEGEILENLEARRDYSAVNYYQLANFPPLKGVHIFDDMGQLQGEFPSGKFVCPNCGGISTHPTTCNSGVRGANDLPCDWKAWGLLRTFGTGYWFIVKDDFLAHPVVHEIFMPLELHESPDAAVDA